MRETLQQAAKKMLKDAVGAEHTITIDQNDGLTGSPPGGPQRGARIKVMKVRVDEEARKDGKKRKVVVLQPKGKVVAASDWQ